MSLLACTTSLLRVTSCRLPATLSGRLRCSAASGGPSSSPAQPSDTATAEATGSAHRAVPETAAPAHRAVPETAAPAHRAVPETAAPALTATADTPLFSMENPFLPERRQCAACRHDVRFDYKNVRLLSQFVSPFTGRMYGRHVTGLCREQQRRLEEEYRKAVACGYMGVMVKAVEFLRDPKICDPTNPVRPHRF